MSNRELQILPDKTPDTRPRPIHNYRFRGTGNISEYSPALNLPRPKKYDPIKEIKFNLDQACTEGINLPLFPPYTSDFNIDYLNMTEDNLFYRTIMEPISAQSQAQNTQWREVQKMLYEGNIKSEDEDDDKNEDDDDKDDDDDDDDDKKTKSKKRKKKTLFNENESQDTGKDTWSKPVFSLPPQHQPIPLASDPIRSFTFDQVVTASNLFGEKSDNDQGIFNSKRHKPYTHFVSIPVGKIASAHKSALEFLSSLCVYTIGEAGSLSAFTTHLTPELVERVERLHITLLLLRLPEPRDVELAKELLHKSFESAWHKAKASLLMQYKSSEREKHFKKTSTSFSS